MPVDLDPHGLIQMIFLFKGVMIQVPFALSFWGSIIWMLARHHQDGITFLGSGIPTKTLYLPLLLGGQ